MISDEQYEICLPILEDPNLEDEEKTDKLEETLREKTDLTGASLDNVVLDALWRYRDGGNNEASPPPIRQTILRRPSPAYPWRTTSGTPLSGSPRLGVSPLAPPGFVPTTFGRSKVGGAAASPFSSPRPSPRLALAQPVPIPSSPSLQAYEFAYDSTPAAEISAGEYPGESVDWLVGGDDAISLSSSVGTGSMLNAAAPEFSSSFSSTSAFSTAAAAAAQAQAQQAQAQAQAMAQAQAHHPSDMTPYDMLRTILGASKTDEEIETALAMNNYDLSATIASMVGFNEDDSVQGIPEEPRSMAASRSFHMDTRPSTPVGGQKNIICKFYLSAGQCLRADCRFSHDLSNHLCKYWVMGNCLAGETCIFSHDPAQLVSKLAIEGTRTPPTKHAGIAIHDYNSFPALGPGTPDHPAGYGSNPTLSLTPPTGFRGLPGNDIIRPRSRPGSRHNYAQHQTKEMAPALDDPDAFPQLGAMPKQGKKHHGKRGGHNHGSHKDSGSGGGHSLLADIVRMAPSPASDAALRPDSRRMVRNNSSSALRNGENSPAAMAIPNPKHIPWLETGERANKAYLKARHDALRHYGQRNKFLQNAAQAWNRNDVRAAKALSLRGQSENELMRRAHREAARELYEERSKNSSSRSPSDSDEIYVDLHGLHAEEAVAYLEQVLAENDGETRPVYAITGTAYHSKSGRDKVGKAIRSFLNEWRYAFREFAVPGDRNNNLGGILGIDARSWDRTLSRDGFGGSSSSGGGSGSDSGGGGAGESVPAEGGGALLTPAPAAATPDKEVGGVELEAAMPATATATAAVVAPIRMPAREPPKGPSGRR